MKTLIIIASILIIFIFSRMGYSIPQYNLTAMNFTFTSSNALEFDIYLQHIPSGSDPVFWYSMGQYMLNMNAEFANNGNLTYSIVSGDIEAYYPLVFPPPPGIPGSSIQLRLITDTPGDGYIISTTAPGSRLVRMRLTTTAPRFCGSLDLQWRNKSNAGGFYTKIFSSDDAYLSTSTNITPLFMPNHFVNPSNLFSNCSRCDSLTSSAVKLQSGNCCWNVNLIHPFDMSGIRKIQFLTQYPETYSSFTLNSAYSSWIYYSNSPANKTVGPLSGNLPSGSLNDFANLCLNNVTTSPQRIFVNWLTNGDTIVCRDTLILECDVPCMNFSNDTAICLDSSYTVKFDFNNNSNFAMGKLVVTPLNAPNAVVTPSNILLNTPIPSGGNASNITFNLSNVTAPSQVSFLIKAISPDSCCWCYDTLYVDILQCTCENLGYELIRTGNPCNWTLNLINNYSGSYFTGVQTEIITNGVVFKSQSPGPGPNYWVTTNPTISPVTWLPQPIGSFIQLGNTNDQINFILTGYSTTPQKMVLRWMRGSNRDTVVCTDTLVFDCTPPYPVTNNCSQIVEDTLVCMPDSTFEYRFKVQNNSAFDATGFQLNSFSPSGAVLTPSDFPSVTIPSNTVSSQQIMSISGVTVGQEVCFGLSLYRHIMVDTIYYSECCHSDTMCLVMPVCQPYCDTACLTDSLNVSTGFNHNTGTLYPGGSWDEGWQLVSSPPLNGVQLPRPAGVIRYDVWVNQPGSKWLTVDPQHVSQPGSTIPYIYETRFCMCYNNSNIYFQFGVMADNSATVWLDDELIVTPPISFYSPTAVSFSRTLDQGEHILQIRVINDGIYTGMNVSGNITGSGILKHTCCRNNGITTGVTGTGEATILSSASLVLMNPISPFNPIDTALAFSDSLGNLTLQFSHSIPNGSYYFVIKSKNTLETWSASPQTITGDSLSYDFTTAISQAFGNNMVLVNGKWCFYSGDVNQDGVIDASDISLTDNDAYNNVSGDVVTDLNGDEFVDASDLSIVDNNVFNFVSVVRPSGALEPAMDTNEIRNNLNQKNHKNLKQDGQIKNYHIDKNFRKD